MHNGHQHCRVEEKSTLVNVFNDAIQMFIQKVLRDSHVIAKKAVALKYFQFTINAVYRRMIDT